jgi:hypothetical protein
MLTTNFGSETDLRDENACDSIRFNKQSDSNVISTSDLHPEKHLEPRISTLRGTQRMAKSDDENASDLISRKQPSLPIHCHLKAKSNTFERAMFDAFLFPNKILSQKWPSLRQY